MTKALNNEKGFTLIEMLFVLFIVILFSGIAFSFTIQYSEKKVVDRFMNQLELDILVAQAKAIEEEQTVGIRFTANKYTLFTQFGGNVDVRDLPNGITFNVLSNLKEIKFTTLGEVVGFGTLQFRTFEGEKRMIINIHKGRIRYEK